MTPAQRGAHPDGSGTDFAVWSSGAARIEVCLFDAAGGERRLPMARGDDGVFRLRVGGVGQGVRYGYRADGPYEPARGLWFDPDKLLMDPYAVEIDRPYVYDPRLTAPRGEGGDTAPLMPKAVVVGLLDSNTSPPLEGDSATLTPPSSLRGGVRGGGMKSATPFAGSLFHPDHPIGLIYEINVRAFTMHHPDVPEARRGAIAALAEPAAIDHLLRLGVSAVELMPVTAWIDERHLPPLGLANGWGYNPVTFMALDPRLAPGGLADLRTAVGALHAAGIGVILDLVFNHTGESDALGPTLSLRGLDALAYYRHAADATLVNDTGTGNTLRSDHPVVRAMILDTLRHFVRHAGVDGFRFDLATTLGRTAHGFDPHAALIEEMRADPLLKDRVLVAEPWDIGPGGYQLGCFGPPFLEWNDRFRDDLRRFWRGDGTVGALATRLAGSSDVFDGAATRTVNFVAAHDGMTLADLVAYERKHNEANGEDNRDGHDENLSWNCGVEGATDDPAVLAARRRDAMALIATLFSARGAIMLAAGDEFGRSQGGNNNAYAQDNDVTWLDWQGRDAELEAFAGALSALRAANPALRETAWLSGARQAGSGQPDVAWLSETGRPLAEADWNDPGRRRLAMVLDQAGNDGAARIAVVFNGDRRAAAHTLPARPGFAWRVALASAAEGLRDLGDASWLVPGRAVVFLEERADGVLAGEGRG